MASGANQVQILSYQLVGRSDNRSHNSRSSASLSPDVKELPSIPRKLQSHQEQQPAKPKKKKTKQQQQQQKQQQQKQKSFSDTESRAPKPQQQPQKQHRQATVISSGDEWRNPNEVDYSYPSGRRRDQQLQGINAPLLHRRLDAALQRIDRIGSPKKLKKEMRELRQQFADLESRIQDYQEMRDSLTYQQGVVASVNARLSKLESEMKRIALEAGELTHLIKTPGALEEEQVRVTREKISKKRQQSTSGSTQAAGSKAKF